MSRVWTITKTKGSPIEIPKGIADGDTIEILGDQLEERTSDADQYDDFSVISAYHEAYYHLVFKNGQKEILGYFKQSHLLSVDAPDVVKVDDFAFSEADRLEEVHLPSLRYIGSRAFQNCPRLKPFRITRDIEHIGERAFAGCELFEAFDVDPSNPRIASKDGVLYSKDMKELLVYPQARSNDEFIDEDVEVVRADAFWHCNFVKSVSLPNVRRVEVDAFYHCGQLMSLSLPSLEEIALDPEFKSAYAIDMCPAWLIRIGKEPPTSAGHLIGCWMVDADMHSVSTRVLVPDLSRYADFMPKGGARWGGSNYNDKSYINGLTELPEGGAFSVDEPLKSVFQIRIGDEVTTDISKRVIQLIRIADAPIDSGVFTDPDATLRNRRLKRHRMRKFINKTQIFLRELRTLLPDAHAKIELTVEHNWIWEQNWGDDPCFVNVEPPRGCSTDRPYWEIRIDMEIKTPTMDLKGSDRAWICGSMVQEHIRDDLSWLWHELGKTDFERHVDVADDGLSWDIDEVIA